MRSSWAHNSKLFGVDESPAPPTMYIVVTGNLFYLSKYGKQEKLGEASWVAEMVLWLHWNHRGDCITCKAIVIAIDATRFQIAIASVQSIREYACVYARSFLRAALECQELTDLALGSEEDICCDLPSATMDQHGGPK